MIRIRLRRTGKKRQPFYRVVVANKTAKRDGAFLATLGSYDPHASPPLVVLDEAKTREWLGKGAQPSEAAEKVLRRAGIAAAIAGPAEAAGENPASGQKKRAAVAAEQPAGRAEQAPDAETAPAAKTARTTKAKTEAPGEEEAPAEPAAAEEED